MYKANGSRISQKRFNAIIFGQLFEVVAINISEGEKQKRVNEANGRAEGIKLIADSTAQSLKVVGEAISLPGGNEALKMRIIDQYIEQLDEVLESGAVSLFPANLASLKWILEEL